MERNDEEGEMSEMWNKVKADYTVRFAKSGYNPDDDRPCDYFVGEGCTFVRMAKEDDENIAEWFCWTSNLIATLTNLMSTMTFMRLANMSSSRLLMRSTRVRAIENRRYNDFWTRQTIRLVKRHLIIIRRSEWHRHAERIQPDS